MEMNLIVKTHPLCDVERIFAKNTLDFIPKSC
jgi:hypothetical protein